MNQISKKQAIKTALQALNQPNLTQHSLALFNTLGYNTHRKNPLPHKTYAHFKHLFIEPDSQFNEEKAITTHWQSIDILFQLSSHEITPHLPHFSTQQIDNTIIESYLFIALQLSQAEYTRTALAHITRQINKLFPMPVLILFKHGQHLTLAIINRRLHKKQAHKDVLEKVTVIKDISLQTPHRAHLDILFDLSFEQLSHTYPLNNFVDLHHAWQKTLDTNALNKRFYRDLSHWYFWAMQHVTFPTDNLQANKDSLFQQQAKIREHTAKNLIRLLTRLLFVWFVKEKKLIPPQLFNQHYLQTHLLNTFQPHKQPHLSHKQHSSHYYKAILQNLFFASLNQSVGKRQFRKPKQHHNITNLMRYKAYFKNHHHFKSLIEETVPFMNGGLFECLDTPHPTLTGPQGGPKIMYEDGFSDRKDNLLCVPDYIFFGQEERIDLSQELGSKKQKNIPVKGLIHILNAYKFTVTENTPIEEDIALDPELLGRVFENLLASYNPETQTTARKQTGSFYTPREIVNYMVDQSLTAYLSQSLQPHTALDTPTLENNLQHLIAYTQENNPFNQTDSVHLIQAIDRIKILDPACGSGAFPMGILHKLVHILHKLDPNNQRWKERQLEKAYTLDDPTLRDNLIDDIETAFNNNQLDYGRKLYLIENCIYGIDIQPIATQISKLRFFISLIVDQKADPSHKNFGIRPLPNLETKFVAANALIGLDKPSQQMNMFIDNKDIKHLENTLKDIRHRLFSAKTPPTKAKLRAQDKALRQKISTLLIKRGWNNQTARQLADWDPYNQNSSSPFFDPEWMFGVGDGFDVVIGNPPYIKEYTSRSAFDGLRDSPYYQGKMDIWYLFACTSLDILKEDSGVLSFIATNNWLTNYGASILRNKIRLDATLLQLIDFGNFKIFESASIQTMILICLKKNSVSNYIFDLRRIISPQVDLTDVMNMLAKIPTNSVNYLTPKFKRDQLKNKLLVFSDSSTEIVLNKLSEQANFKLDSRKEVANGIDVHQDFVNKKSQKVLGAKFNIGDGIFILSNAEKTTIPFTTKELELIKPYYTTSELYKYHTNKQNSHWIIYTDSSFKNQKKLKNYPNIKKHLDQFRKVITSDNWPYGLHRSRNEYFFQGTKIISVRKCLEPTFTYTDFDCYVSQTFYVIKSNRINLKYLTGVLNSKVIAFWLKHKGKMQGYQFQIDKAPLLDIPLRYPKLEQQSAIETLVNQILTAKAANPTANTSTQEAEIDRLVYQLYGLTEEEIAIIES